MCEIDGFGVRSNKYILVHGICVMPIDGEDRDYSHAWVETKENCIDAKMFNGEKVYVEYTHEEFNRIFKVKSKTRYNMEQLLEENRKSGMYGPWKDEYKKLCGVSKAYVAVN